MGKSVYSIVLDDEVAAAADELAYRLGTNRSGLINDLLAERTGCVTPEMRMREIFSLVEQALDRRFLPAPQSSGTVLMIRTALRYKYNPTLKYSVELFRSLTGRVGQLKVSLRSQSAELVALCEGFFEMWLSLEMRFCGQLFQGGFPGRTVPKGYTRDFYEIGSGGLSDEDIAGAITAYIRCFDKALALYVDSPDTAEKQCEEVYKDYLAEGVRVV